MSQFLEMRASSRAELEEIYVEVFGIIYEEFRREIQRQEKEAEDPDEDPYEPPTPLEMLAEVLDRTDGDLVGLREFVDALDRDGWELLKLGPRARLTSPKRSDKTRKPRIKRLAR